MSTIVVHGGAGRETLEDGAARDAGIARALEAGWAVLARGGDALDAAIASVIVLEDDPHFNAGLGSVLTVDGVVEMDASVMEGTGLRAGAVGAVRGVRNPVRLARAVLDEGREVLLVGEPAAALADRHAIARCPPDALVTPEAQRRWREQRAAPGETVGAVARDARGRVAAATSTGGVAGKRAGRIGDSAIIGAGTYADDGIGAASATGPGEGIIRVSLVRLALDLVARGSDPATAAARALDELQRRLGMTAGLILVDREGRVASAHTTEAMAAAWRSEATASF